MRACRPDARTGLALLTIQFLHCFFFREARHSEAPLCVSSSSPPVRWAFDNRKREDGRMSNRAWRREHFEPSISENIEQRPKGLNGVLAATVLLKIRALAQGDNPVELRFDAAKLDYPSFRGEAILLGTIRREGDRLDLKGTVSAEGEFECTRCTTDFHRQISAPVSLHFVPARMMPNAGDSHTL